MKRITLLFALVCLYHIAVFGQKKYEMVIEKTDGSTIVVKTEDIARTYFREIEENNNNEGDGEHDARLIGTWWDADTKEPCGFIFEANGRYYYDEWKLPQEGFTNINSQGTWSTNDNYITTVRDDGKSETLRYEFSSDGQTLFFYEQSSEGESCEYILVRM